MPLDVDRKKKIKESLDYDEHGRLRAIANKAAALDAPVLIVGLGGTGVDSVIKVKKMIYDRIKCEQTSGEVRDKPKNIEYLVMDTSLENENKSLQGIGFSEALEESYIFTSPNIQTILANPLPSYIESWLSKDIRQEQVLNGAGGVRQLGRLMLFLNIHKIVATLETKIARVTAGYPSAVPLYVFLISGISGGTGSGTFLDIPYIIKEKAFQIDSGRPVQNIGLIFLPDVNLSQPGIKETKKENIKRNGFAAMKELDYLMNLEASGDHFEQDYGPIKVGSAGGKTGAPYDVCILMSSKDKRGVTIVNPYEYTINVAAETVVNFIASEDVSSFQQFSINSFISNEMDDRDTFVNMLGENKRPVNYKYSIAGASSARLPLDDIISYMASLAFREVRDLYNKRPTQEEVTEVLNSFGIDERALEMELCQNSPRRTNMERHTFNLIKQNPKLIDEEYNAVLVRQQGYLNTKMLDMVKEMKKKIADPNNRINDIFKDVEKGPVVAQQMLYTTSGNLCVTKKLKDLNLYFMTNKPTSQQLQVLRTEMQNQLRRLLNSKQVIGALKNKIRDEFVKSCDDYYDALFKTDAYTLLAALCSQYSQLFMDRNNEIYDCIADLLRTLITLFEKYADIRSEQVEEVDEYSKTMSWNLIETPVFIKELEQRMGKNGDLYIDLHGFVTKFYSYLFENVDIWTGKEKADIIEKLNAFISGAFEVVIDKSMDYYLDFISKSQGKSLTQYCDELFGQLYDRANIMFPIRSTYHTTVEQPGYSFVSVPSNAREIGERIRAHMKGKSIIKESGIKESIFIINFESAVPLSSYADLSMCHDSYSTLLPTTPGLHLYEGKKKNWSDLPSPYPQSEWLAGHKIEREAAENEALCGIFDKALEYGYLTWEDDSRRYVCRWGGTVDYAAVLKEENVNPDAELNDFARANKCTKVIKRALSDEGRLAESLAVYDTKMKTLEDESVVPDIDYAKALFIKMYSARKAVKNMVENHEQCLEVLDKLKKYADIDESVVAFINCIVTGTLIKKRGEYVFEDRTEKIQLFGELNGKQNHYPDYYLFQLFMAADDKKRGDLLYMADKNKSAMKKTDESYEEMRGNLQSYVLELTERIEKLKAEIAEEEPENGDTMLLVYRSLFETAQAELGKF